jgi:hypothetical protein
MPKNDAIANFVHQQNIERYRKLLRVPLDVRQRQAILNLLAQEEAAEQGTTCASEKLTGAATLR